MGTNWIDKTLASQEVDLINEIYSLIQECKLKIRIGHEYLGAMKAEEIEEKAEVVRTVVEQLTERILYKDVEGAVVRGRSDNGNEKKISKKGKEIRSW